jgi:outer membrane receptor protein involved in Fe transport
MTTQQSRVWCRMGRGAAATGLSALAMLFAPGEARAQAVDIEVPTVVFDTAVGPETTESDEELDLANIVQSAAKGVTTVQEAPAIVTVITSDDIRQRGFANFEQLADTVPGWLRLGTLHSQFPFPMTRGQVQATLFMHNGMALFDTLTNVPATGKIQPIENIKRVEFITGPGGVLWGANSYMGIVNVITKDAEDVDGVEIGGTLGDGPGERGLARIYAMVGIPRLFRDDWKLFLHTDFESYKGPAFQMPQLIFASPLPQPNAPKTWGPLVESDQARSTIFNLDGKLTLGNLAITFQYPYIDRFAALGFPGVVSRTTIEQDSARDPDTGELLCPNEPPYYLPDDECLDRGRIGRQNRPNHHDYYVMAEYRTRLADGKAGVAAKAYAQEINRDFAQVNVLSPVPVLLEGGLSFKFVAPTYRVGGAFDGDVELPKNARLLYGAEAVREWIPDNVTRSRQGAGLETQFIAPYYEQLGNLPIPCPREPDPDMPGSPRFLEGCPMTFMFESSRTVLGVYANPQWKVTKKLSLDGGARLQIAPEALGKYSFDLTPIFSGALVYNFLPDWHLKANYAEGFRPPVFTNLAGNKESVQIGGRQDLEVETSQAIQGEINGRLFKGDRRIRELTFRADYSYTKLQNLIQIVGGEYANTADRGISSAELLARLYIQGGHRIELAYTYLRVNTQDAGVVKALPEHWFNLTGVFNVVSDKVQLMSNLRVLGSYEDPNRLVDVRGLHYNEFGQTLDGNDMLVGAGRSVQPHELVFDHLPPGAELTIGLSYTPTERWHLAAFAYNVFNERYYQPDAFYSLEPRLEFLPNPYEDFRFQVKATYDY